MSSPVTSPFTGITDEQVDGLLAQLRVGILGSGMRSGPFNQMLELAEELKLGERLVEFIEQIASEAPGYFTIPVNYDEPRAFENAVEAGDFGESNIFDIAIEDIPLGGTGEMSHEVQELDLGFGFHTDVLSCHLPIHIESRNVQFVDVLTALRYVAKLPNRQRKHRLGILFTNAAGKQFSLVFMTERGKRIMEIMEDNPDNNWKYGWRFLVVPKVG